MDERKTQGTSPAARSGPQPSVSQSSAKAAAADDHLPTTRLPPLPAPPSQSPGRGAATGSPSGGPPPPPSRPSLPASEPPVSLPMTRGPRLWRHWTDAFASLFHGPGSDVRTHAGHPMAFVSTVIGLTLVVLGIAQGLRSVPVSSTFEPVVIASLVIARALAGLGMVILGVWFLRLGERLALGKQ
jgi:hypothetical protein